MKKLFIFLAIMLLPCAVAYAGPFLVSDAPTVNNVNYYTITGDTFAGFTGQIAAQTNGSIRVDLVGIPTGTHNINVAACSTLWGCSATVPFSFAKQLPALPAGIGLAP
jgi:hypothetical protein